MSNCSTVAFVVGKGRSGSTILGDVLGTIEGVFHAGELWRFWSEGLSGTHSCGCGQQVSNCAIWGEVLERLTVTPAGKRAVEDPQRFADLLSGLFTFGGIARLVPRPQARRDAATEVRDVNAAMYQAIGVVTASDLIIDTSKWPLDPMLLRPTAPIQTYGIHLVRDPRDVAASWRRTKHFPDTGQRMPTFGSLHTSASWMARNLAAEWATKRIGNRMIPLRYEDFVESPQSTVDAILRHVGFRALASGIFSDGNWVNLKPGHTIMGNPSRFDLGAVQIEVQKEPTEANLAVTALTSPLRRRYKYSN